MQNSSIVNDEPAPIQEEQNFRINNQFAVSADKPYFKPPPLKKMKGLKNIFEYIYIY